MKEFFLRRPWTLLALGGIILLTLCLVLFKPSRFEPTGDQRFDFWIKWQSQEKGEEAIRLYESAIENSQESFLKAGEAAHLSLLMEDPSTEPYKVHSLELRYLEALDARDQYGEAYYEDTVKLKELGYNGPVEVPFPEP